MQKNNTIMKFGGTSVGSAEAIQQIHTIVVKEQPLCIVVSAFTKVTDQLITMGQYAREGNKEYKKLFKEVCTRHLDSINELILNPKTKKHVMLQTETVLQELEIILIGISLIKELSQKTLAVLMSFGERLSAYIISESFREKNLQAEFVDARKIIKTDNSFASAKVNFKKTNNLIKHYFQKHSNTIPVVTGFIASTEDNETTTLGRGGSDYTAAILGAALSIERIEIWTDVDGVMSADPRKVSTAFSIEGMTYREAMEMSHFGAKVIYPSTMVPAMEKQIPIIIKNTFHPKHRGTVIGKPSLNNLPIKGITSISNIVIMLLEGSSMVGIPGISMRLFGALGKNKINIILITQASSEHTICFAIDPKDLEKAKKAIEDEFVYEIKDKVINPVIVEENLSIIAVVGEYMHKTPGVAAKIFTTLSENNISVVAIAQGSSELNISIAIAKKDELKALNAIHEAFFQKIAKESVTIFLIGIGLIGNTLLEQIKETQHIVRQNKLIELKIVGIANQQTMLLEKEGINLKNWRTELENKKIESNIHNFISKMQHIKNGKTVFVDCTASNDIPFFYKRILESGISIVTPNKKGNSGTMKLYNDVRAAAKKGNTKFLYETNIGAGLPIVNTIKNFIHTGDTIVKIEGIFSGTLSYIFNNFTDNKKFSEIVYQAKLKGYTEPDPRDDLNGLDFGRKLLILAREIGLSIELDDIDIENLVSENARNAKSVDDFFQLLKRDNYFEQLKNKAKNEKKALRYIGNIDVKNNQKIYCRLELVDNTHPFYTLSGSDNIAAIYSKRYSETPLVIKGPGAGAEVTAAGVFADILSLVN